MSLQALLFRIEQLERKLAEARGGEAGAGGPASQASDAGPAATTGPTAATASAPTQPAPSTAATVATTATATTAGAPAGDAPRAGGGESEARPSTLRNVGDGRASDSSDRTRPPRQADAQTGAATAVAIEQEPQPEPDTAQATPLTLDRLRAIWPSVVDAVRSENAMVGACLEGARPDALEGDRLTIAFPVLAGFSRKTVERNRELLQTSLRAIAGHGLTLEYSASDDVATEDHPTAGLSEDELIERLKREYGATEVFDDDEAPPEEG
jgi:DNA polymerase-3 subunit gamma/tau